jgi:signal transduction histidine kinase
VSAEVLGQVIHSLLRTGFSRDLGSITAELLAQGSWQGELSHVRADGRRILVDSRWALQRDEQGRPTAILEINRDVTDQSRVQKELRESHNQLEQRVAERTAKLQETIGDLEAFSYSLSHDMRAPLRAMSGFADAVLTDYAQRLDSTGVDFLRRIARGAHRLDLLIRDVLSYSRTAKAAFVPVPVDLDRLLTELISDYPQLQQRGVHITIQTPLGLVLGHEAFLSQILSNLLNNAVKFVRAGVAPAIHVRSEPLGSVRRVWVEDNGIGIAPEHFERIFAMFGRVYPERQFEGTGIGLAIAKKAVERMGGALGVESVLQEGSRFWFTLATPA